jgi:CDP-diacylglycerol--glycerol-3-phosphate 3-phosphatidyltransferase
LASPGPGNEAGPSRRPEPSLINLPNGLTLLRLALVPVVVVLLVTDSTTSRIAAFVVFGLASVTDLLDGELARRSGMITDFGKIADPIADKALIGSALITLSALGALSWWLTGIIAAREVGVTLLRFWVIRYGVIPASRGGKIKTVLQTVAIGLYILPVDIGLVRDIVMLAAVAVTLVTGADYVARAIQLRRRPGPGSLPAQEPAGAYPQASPTGEAGAAQ